MNIKDLRLKHGLSQQDVADKTGIPRPRIAKWEEGKGNPKAEDSRKLENFFSKFSEETEVNEPEPDYSQPIIQVVLNLSYTSKKNADSMDKMAATNQKNTEIIAALVGAILPNSKLANQLTSTLADLHKGGDRPVEDFLPPGTDLSKKAKKEFVKKE